MITRRELALMVGPLLAAGLLSNSGCTRIGIGQSKASAEDKVSDVMDAEALFKARTAYLGDNISVLAQLNAVDLNALTGFRVSLETDIGRPLRLGILPQNPHTDDVNLFRDRMRVRAALWLACIGNADSVFWEAVDHIPAGELRRTMADTWVGGPISELASSPDALLELARRLER